MAESSSKTSVEEEPAIVKSERPDLGEPAVAEPPALPEWELLSMSALSNSSSFNPPPQTAVASDKEIGETNKKNDEDEGNPNSTPLPPPPPPMPDSPEPFSEGWKPRGIFSTASSDPPPQPLHLAMADSPSSSFPPPETLNEEEKEEEKGEEREEEEQEEEEEEGVVSMAALENSVQCSRGEKVGDSERGQKKGRTWMMPPTPPLWSVAIASVAIVGLVCLWHHERSHNRSLLMQISSQNEEISNLSHQLSRVKEAIKASYTL